MYIKKACYTITMQLIVMKTGILVMYLELPNASQDAEKNPIKICCENSCHA